ncbi:acetylserotonin O-methyltransferase 2 isoform X1, partial [Tachysurus ichikawai]
MTIDEQLFPTKVCCPFTQYITTKPDKFGIKFWMATDLETKYVCNASPYLGKDPSRKKGERLAESVVMNLMEPFLDDGRNVTTDNFFTSLSLSHRLLQQKNNATGHDNAVPGARELQQTRSRFTCATCQKFTCAKCRDDGHWVCKRCKV